MSRQEHILTVFVASPDDVRDERDKLEEVIRELNETWSRTLGVRLDLVRWDTHAYPGIGTDAQAVINEQIPEDYDIFVGIMWCRYGTPTGRAGSGTVEEFECAKKRYDADPLCVGIMVYFKDEARPPSQIDPGQLAKVKEFRDSLGKKGGLYWEFTGIDAFEKLIRMHLARRVQAWKARLERSDTSAKIPSSEVSISEHETEEKGDDLGILDLMESFEDRAEELENISERIGKAGEDLGKKMSDRTAEMEKLVRSSKGNASRKEAKRLIARIASDMDQFTACVDAELPLLSDALNVGMNAIIQAVPMLVDLQSDGADMEQAKEGLDAIVSLRHVLEEAEESIIELRATIAAIPRLATRLNRAKRGASGALDRLIDVFTNGQMLVGEYEKVFREVFLE